MVISQLAKNIQFLRKKEKLSQQAFGLKVGLTRSNIASYENGKAEPRATKLVRMAKYFQINLSQLIEIDLQQLSEDAFEDSKTNSVKKKFLFSIQQEEVIEQFLMRSQDLNTILDGFKEFYKFKMQSLQDNDSNDTQSLVHDFENLLSVMENLQQLNQELIDFIKDLPHQN